MSSLQPPISVGTIINEKWRVCGELGSGNQGVVYSAVDIDTGHNVAVKTQRTNRLRSPLMAEYRAYSTINENKRSSSFAGIPDVYHYDEDEGRTVAVMVMDRLGPTLTELFLVQGGLLSRKTLLMLLKHILISIQNVHESGYIHRDIKPDNICMGRAGKAGVVHLIDFGISERYIDEETGNHVPMINDGSFSGTIKFASVHALSGLTSSRRDDLESLIYVIMFLWTGSLPFASVDKDNIKRAIQTSKIEKSRDVAEICKGYHRVIQDLLSYVRSLEFDETPDYVMMRGLVENEFDELGFKEDGFFDWFYSSDGDEVVSSPANLDQVYDKISSLIQGESSSADDRNVTCRQDGRAMESCDADNDEGGTRRMQKASNYGTAGNDDERSSSGCLKEMLSRCTGSILRRMKSVRTNTNVVDSEMDKNRRPFDSDNSFCEVRDGRIVERKNVVRRLISKLARNKK